MEKMNMPSPEAQDVSHEAKLEIEVLDAFEQAGYPLSYHLREMLSEAPEHRYDSSTSAGIRRGGGLMQATRVLSKVIDAHPDKRNAIYLFDERARAKARRRKIYSAFSDLPEDLAGLLDREQLLAAQMAEAQDLRLRTLEAKQVDSDEVKELSRGIYELEGELSEVLDLEYCALEKMGRSDLYRVDQDDLDLPALRAAEKSLVLEEGKLIGRMLLDILDPYPVEGLPLAEEDKRIGTCTSAEIFFNDLARLHPHYHETPDIVLGKDGKPSMIFKNAGERSAITLKETVLNGVRLPPGSLMSIELKEGAPSGTMRDDDCAGFRFLRLTTLAISPENRLRAFGMAVRLQQEQGFYRPTEVTIDDLARYAESRCINPDNPFDKGKAKSE